ncbi:MAG: vancomycin resistance protein [Meiothermus sp.]|uniref:VanW family protein n=1 Tax=Thermus sp. TaxID=275 RepID=UPI003333C7A8
MRLWFFPLALSFGVALEVKPIPEAVLVVREEVLEGGEVKAYVGTKRQRVASEQELRALIRAWTQEPRPPRFVWEGGRWRGVEKVGRTFDEEEALAAFRKAWAEGRASFLLPARQIPPKPSLRDLYRLGVRDHLATAETDYRGSHPNRIHNLRLAASRLDGLLIPPGVFSFNRALGEVSEQAGYKEAYVILGDRTEQGVGGGVCQVSTTFFRAAYFAGLPILERHPHSYLVRYYTPPGLDASVFQPYLDLRVENDTPGHLYVQSSIQGTRLRFHLFGTKDRAVRLEGPVITDREPPLAERRILDPSLPPDAVKQVDFAAEGMTVYWKRVVRYQSGKERVDGLQSRYKPWGAVFLVGPRPEPPEGGPAPPEGGREALSGGPPQRGGGEGTARPGGR